MTAEESLKANFDALGFPEQASDWLIELFRFVQTWDDLFDGDPVNEKDLAHTLFLSMHGLHNHPFHLAHAHLLSPMLLSTLMKWRASDLLEKAGDFAELPKCYMWRAGYYDVVLQVMFIVHGSEFTMNHGHLVLKLYGEKLSDLEEEFNARSN